MKISMGLICLFFLSFNASASTAYYSGNSGAYSGSFVNVKTNEYLISENTATLRVCGINVRYDGTVRGFVDYTFEIKENPASNFQNLISDGINVGTYKEGSFKFSIALDKDDPTHFFNEFRFIKGSPVASVYYREVGAFSGDLSVGVEIQETPSETLMEYCK